jgi:hypothetical protein
MFRRTLNDKARAILAKRTAGVDQEIDTRERIFTDRPQTRSATLVRCDPSRDGRGIVENEEAKMVLLREFFRATSWWSIQQLSRSAPVQRDRRSKNRQ